MPLRFQPILGAMLGVVALSCARLPARDAREAPTDTASAPAPTTRAAADRAAAAVAVVDDLPPATPAAMREAVSGVAVARGMPAYGTPRALHAIARMLERISGDDSAAASATRRMRGAIEALEQLRGFDLERADRVKEALERGAEAIRAVARRRRAAWLDPWADAAADAAAAVDPATPLGLQRAAVQDALRSLADAVVVADQFAKR